MAKAPDPSRVARNKVEDTPKTVRIDGRDYAFNPSDITGRQDAEIFGATRKACGEGMSFMQIMAGMEAGQVTLFGLAAIVWVCRRQAGEQVTYDEMLDTVTFDSVAEIIDSVDEVTVSPPP